MTRKLIILLLMFGLSFFLSACGGGGDEAEPEIAAKPQPEAAETNEGVDVAKEILAEYDKAVAETVELLKEKPEVSVVRPQFEALIAGYQEKMTELNAKYLALRDKDIALFGDCNGHMGEYRGKHVFEKDQALSTYITYYRSEKEEGEFAELLSNEFFDLLEIAVKH